MPVPDGVTLTPASMGPRPIGRGNQYFCTRCPGHIGASSSFNGAATNWSRKSMHRTSPLIGVALQLRASMGPRPIGRGNESEKDRTIRSAHVPDSLQWGRDQLVAEMRAADRIWICSTTALQWGRDQLVAEMCRFHWPVSGLGCASMGPRPIGRGNTMLRRIVLERGHRQLQWGRDQLVAEIRSGTGASMESRPGCFNGAATNWSRKSCELARSATYKIFGASMGPRPIGRGNSASRVTRRMACRRFNGAATNWSRKSDTAARGFNGASGKCDSKRYQASMGPRPIGRGNTDSPTAQWGLIAGAIHWPEPASMGPRPIGRGNGLCTSIQLSNTCVAPRERAPASPAGTTLPSSLSSHFPA
jgi:hypothetical protein